MVGDGSNKYSRKITPGPHVYYFIRRKFRGRNFHKPGNNLLRTHKVLKVITPATEVFHTSKKNLK